MKPFENILTKNDFKKSPCVFLLNIQWFDTKSPTVQDNLGLGATKLPRVLILLCIVHPSPKERETQRPLWQQMKLNEEQKKGVVLGNYC